MAKFIGEKAKLDNRSRQTFHYVNDEKKINQLSRELLKNKDVLIHYPIAYNGGPKYKNLQKIEFHNSKKQVPVGFIKSFKKGYGFTRNLKVFANYIDNTLKIKRLIIDRIGADNCNLSKGEVTFNERSFLHINKVFSDLGKKTAQELELASKVCMNKLFPENISRPVKKYTANALSAVLSNWGNDINEFSNKDKETIKDLFEKLSLNTDFLSSSNLSSTKEYIDNKILTSAIKDFDELLNKPGTVALLEKKWQSFLKANNWVFSSIFAQPIILFKDEAYVGGKDINNSNGKFSDYLLKNNLSDNVAFFEIKTHKTALLNSKAYRGVDVFTISDDLSGSINQVLNQKDNFQKEYDHLLRKSKAKFETINSRCIVLIGLLSSLTPEQKHCFELFRNNSRDVEIVTFDELLFKIQNILSLKLKK